MFAFDESFYEISWSQWLMTTLSEGYIHKIPVLVVHSRKYHLGWGHFHKHPHDNPPVITWRGTQQGNFPCFLDYILGKLLARGGIHAREGGLD